MAGMEFDRVLDIPTLPAWISVFQLDIENQYHRDFLDSFKGIFCLQNQEQFISFK